MQHMTTIPTNHEQTGRTFDDDLAAFLDATDATPSEMQDALFAHANRVASERWGR